jgi:hypothetical protein
MIFLLLSSRIIAVISLVVVSWSTRIGFPLVAFQSLIELTPAIKIVKVSALYYAQKIGQSSVMSGINGRSYSNTCSFLDAATKRRCLGTAAIALSFSTFYT